MEQDGTKFIRNEMEYGNKKIKLRNKVENGINNWICKIKSLTEDLGFESCQK